MWAQRGQRVNRDVRRFSSELEGAPERDRLENRTAGYRRFTQIGQGPSLGSRPKVTIEGPSATSFFLQNRTAGYRRFTQIGQGPSLGSRPKVTIEGPSATSFFSTVSFTATERVTRLPRATPEKTAGSDGPI